MYSSFFSIIFCYYYLLALTSLWNVHTFTAENEFVLISAFSENFEAWIAVYSGDLTFPISSPPASNSTGSSSSASSSSSSSSGSTSTSDSTGTSSGEEDSFSICDNLLLVSANTNQSGVIVLEGLIIGNVYSIVITPTLSWLNTTVLPVKGEYSLWILSGTEGGLDIELGTGLSLPTGEGLETQIHVDVDVSGSNALSICVALFASLFLMSLVF